MGKYLKSIKKVIKAMEQKTGLILLLSRQEIFSPEKERKFYILKLRCIKNKKDILSSASEPVFLRQLVELFKLDRKELMRKLQPNKQRGDG
ncbi:hypothetical protein GXM21_07045 [Megamonas funiformis]|uniref:Uncharacterized protein n=1 Tax=Megamonas funiformis YIT 11815 TaxID=742816 RepID=A0ABP2NLU9_9FIRM|nr:hypothetical protein [Megamonas funiformis]EHR38706.1 hypothetical protein HMPREF9454_00511 [Megamonas funiformis YIT 11815]QIB60158.1 hypothetical protein GXM21_07045 [Megamonas funiformis]